MHTAPDKRKFVRIYDAVEGNLLQKLSDVTRSYGVQFKIVTSSKNDIAKQTNGTESNIDTSGYGKWNAFGKT